jgi:hypothetical protein
MFPSNRTLHPFLGAGGSYAQPMDMARPVRWGVVCGGAALGVARYRRWNLRWGATTEESVALLPGDDLLRRPRFRATRALDVDAPPEAVWPWIVQMGFGRAGFYAYDWIDNLGRPSATTVLAEYQDVAVGDLAAPMSPRPTEHTSFRVVEVEPPHLLVWSKPGSVWTWRLTALDGGRTRLLTRLQDECRLPLGVVSWPLLEAGDFPMMRRQLLNIRARAERLSRSGGP